MDAAKKIVFVAQFIYRHVEDILHTQGIHQDFLLTFLYIFNPKNGGRLSLL